MALLFSRALDFALTKAFFFFFALTKAGKDSYFKLKNRTKVNY